MAHLKCRCTGPVRIRYWQESQTYRIQLKLIRMPAVVVVLIPSLPASSRPDTAFSYPFRGRDELPCHFTPERSSLNRPRRRAALSAELSDQAAVMASPHLGDGRSRPAQGTPRYRGPVA